MHDGRHIALMICFQNINKLLDKALKKVYTTTLILNLKCD